MTARPTAAPDRYLERRAWLEQYFDRTAAKDWAALTTEVKVSGVRAKVRAGRAQMRGTLASWLPADLSGARVLDAGCGTGQLAGDLAARGAQVVAIDLSPTLTDLARERLDPALAANVTFLAGDMLDPALGHFDYVVAMDSLIHYRLPDAVVALGRLASRTSVGMVVTFVPRTPLLAAMIAAGRLFPRSDRSPAVEPVAPTAHAEAIRRALPFWRLTRRQRVHGGFYTSEAIELLREAS